MKTEEEIKERIEWYKSCYEMNKICGKHNLTDYYKSVVEALEWVLED